MPELPDVEIYCESLAWFYAGRAVERVSLKSVRCRGCSRTTGRRIEDWEESS